MSKYIDAEKLKVEIDNLESFSCISEEQDGFYSAISRINDIIESFQQEQPEVDLEKEINAWLDSGTYTIRETARHFYELGLNARKEESK